MTAQTAESRPTGSSRRYLRAAENFAKRPRKERMAILRRVLKATKPDQRIGNRK